MQDNIKSIKILNTKVDSVSWNDILNICDDWLNDKTPHQIVTTNGEFILEAQKNRTFQNVINNSDLSICDSTNVYFASYLLGNPLKAITPGSDLVMRLSKFAEEHNYSIYLLGGREDVAKIASGKLVKTYAHLHIAGYSSKDPDDESIINDINKTNPDIVFVAYGAPKQDIWIANNKSKLKAKILVGVGGTFDMLAGVKKRAPKFFQKIRLEWLWRAIIEPKRLGRIANAIIVFPVKFLFDLLKNGRRED